jgi:N-alpha-acetyltransferase 40
MQVDESFQRKGLGGFMMEALEKIARQNNLQKVVLTVLTNNEGGLKFYKRLDYTTDENSPDASENLGYEIMSKLLN